MNQNNANPIDQTNAIENPPNAENHVQTNQEKWAEFIKDKEKVREYECVQPVWEKCYYMIELKEAINEYLAMRAG